MCCTQAGFKGSWIVVGFLCNAILSGRAWIAASAWTGLALAQQRTNGLHITLIELNTCQFSKVYIYVLTF